MKSNLLRQSGSCASLLLCVTLFGPGPGWAADLPKDKPAAGSEKLVTLDIKLPNAAFIGTPPDLQVGSNVEPLPTKPRPLMQVPAGLKNIAVGAKIVCSDKNAPAEALAKLSDGDKEAREQSTIYLCKGTQYMQMDFGSPQELFALVIWHAHNQPKIYRDVVVQVADDQDFVENVRTIFNNDQDNSSALGLGTDREYFETKEGKLIAPKGIKARCVRFYSKGSSESALNEYTEIEVYGRPAK